MQIYLVRIRQRADKSLFLERKEGAAAADDYIAISHVWGTPETIISTEVDGAGAEHCAQPMQGSYIFGQALSNSAP